MVEFEQLGRFANRCALTDELYAQGDLIGRKLWGLAEPHASSHRRDQAGAGALVHDRPLASTA